MPKKISQLEDATDVTASDLIQIIDIEDAGMAVSGTNKKCTAQLMANELGKLTNIVATGSTSSRSLANRFADSLNIKDFGAVGDGVTDDTSAFDLAAADGRVVLITQGSYYLTKTYSGLSNFMILGKVTWANSNFRVIPTFNMYGNMQSKVQSSMTTNRQELQIYANSIASSTGSLGAGIHLYGNGDIEHAGNIVFLTGQDDQGTARMIISGGSSNIASDGYRTNTDTRVTIGNSIWDFVDDGLDTGLLTLKNPIGRPAIYILETSSSEGELAVPNGERLDVGHWDGESVFTARVGFNSSGHVQPGADNTQSMGTSDYRWSEVFSGSGTINTSDGREKQDIESLNDAELRVAASIKRLIKKFKFKHAVEAKGDDARTHVGVIAQEVVDAFAAEGLDAMRYGIVCYDEWPDEYRDITHSVITTQEDGTEVTEHIPTGEKELIKQGGNRYGVRYEELMAFMIASL